MYSLEYDLVMSSKTDVYVKVYLLSMSVFEIIIFW